MVDSPFGQPNPRLLPPRTSMTPLTPPSNLPSFADFKFSTIGREPELLKRFTAPNPQHQYHSPSPDPDDKPMDTEPPPLSLSNTKILPRPTLLEALADRSPVIANASPAEQTHGSAQDVAADSDMQDDSTSSDDIAAMAAVPPRLERQAARSQRQAPYPLSSIPKPSGQPIPPQTQSFPTPSLSTQALPKTNGLPSPSSPSFPAPATGHSGPLITNSSPSLYSETLASSSDVIRSPMTGPSFLASSSHQYPSPFAASTPAIPPNSPLQHTTLQHLQTRMLNSLATLVDLSPPTPASTPLDSSPISLALRLAQSAAQSSISQADMSVLAAQTAHTIAQSSISVGQEAFDAVQESLNAAQSMHVAAQRSCEAARESFSASKVSLSDAQEAKRKADEAMRAVERVSEEIKKREEDLRMREEDIRAREEKIRKVVADTKEVVEALGTRVCELREQERAKGEERRRVELDATRKELDEQEKGWTAGMDGGATRAQGMEGRAEERRSADATTVRQRAPEEDILMQGRSDDPEPQDQADAFQKPPQTQLEQQREQEQSDRDAEERAKDNETHLQREREREDQLRKEQERKRAEVMALKQRANREAGAKIRAEREAKERGRPEAADFVGNNLTSTPAASMAGVPRSPRKGAGSNPTNKGSNVEFGNVVANRLLLPEASNSKVRKEGIFPERGHPATNSPPSSIYTYQPRTVTAGTVPPQSQSSAAMSATSRAILSEDTNKLKGVTDFTSGTTGPGSPVSADTPPWLAAESPPTPRWYPAGCDSSHSPSHSEVSPPSPTTLVPNSSHSVESVPDLEGSAVEMETANAPQEFNIGPSSTTSPVAQATNLRHLTNANGWNVYPLPTVTVKREPAEDAVERTNGSRNSRIGGVTVLPTFDSMSPTPLTTSHTQLQTSSASAVMPNASSLTRKPPIAPSRARKRPKSKGGAGFQVKIDPDAAHVPTPSPRRDNLGVANSAPGFQAPMDNTDVVGGGHSNSSSGRDSDFAPVSRNDTANGSGLAFADEHSRALTPDWRGHADSMAASRCAEYRSTDEHDIRRRNETRVPTGEDRRATGGPPVNAFDKKTSLHSRMANQKRAYYSTQEDEYARSNHPVLPNHLALRAMRGDHWSPPPSAAAVPIPRLSARLPSPSPPPSRKRVREDSSWTSNVQSHPVHKPRYEDSSRERLRRDERATSAQRQEFYTRSYRPARTPSPLRTFTIRSPGWPVDFDNPTSYPPNRDFGPSDYSNPGDLASIRRIIYDRGPEPPVSGNPQPDAGYAQHGRFTNTGATSRDAQAVQTANIAPPTEKTDLLSRMSDHPRPLPVGPSRGTNHKKPFDRPHFQPRGGPAKLRGRGGRSLASRITLEERIG